MAHDRAEGPGGQRPSGEFHEFHFQGVWVPAAVCYALTARQINGTDLAVLICIDATSGPDGRGCTASNRYLGGAVGIGPQPAHRSVAKLIRLGLLRRVDAADGARRLAVAWDGG